MTKENLGIQKISQNTKFYDLCLNMNRKIIKIDIERLSSLVINLANK